MISVRGINVFSERIEEVLAHFDGVGPGYSMKVTEKEGMHDQLKVVVEVSPAIFRAPGQKREVLQETLQFALRRALGPRVEVELNEKKA